MKPRPLLLLAGVVLLGAIGVWIWRGRVETSTPMVNVVDAGHGPAVPTPTKRADGTQPDVPVRIASSVIPGTPMASGSSTSSRPTTDAAPTAPNQSAPRPLTHPEARADLENIRLMLRDFRTRLGGNPVGSNAEIMKAVMGGNSAKANLGPPEGQILNDKGELVDRWGTPYFFHQLSRNDMEIRSAGPDRILWTSDDLIGR